MDLAKNGLKTSWAGKTVLVTGAGGFVGSHLAERLVREHADVRALVHYNSADSWGWLNSSDLAKDMKIIRADITDKLSVSQAVNGVDYVFHLAALISIPYSYTAPESYVQTNVVGTFNILDAALKSGVTRLIHTSTSEVYGTAITTPIDESHPLQAQSPYAATKIAADKLVEAYHLSFGLPVVTVRPFNTFGPRQSARAVIPNVITQAITSHRIRMGSLTPTRDFNYVDNSVDGYLAAALGGPEVLGRAINLGTGVETSIGDLVKLVGQLVGTGITVECEEQRLRPEGSEVKRLLACNKLAARLINWTPRVQLEEGLSRTIDWIQQNMTRYRPGVYVT